MIFQIEFICGSLEKGKDGVGDYTRLLADKVKAYQLATTLHEYHDWGKLQDLKKENTLYSWQFVPYAYNAKGIVWPSVRSSSAMLRKKKVHIMFHELWIGGIKESTIKNKIIGFLQRRSIKKMLRSVGPALITTSNLFYQNCLQKLGFEAYVLPVFSNIPQGDSQGLNVLWNDIPVDITLTRKDHFIITWFGKTVMYKEFWEDLDAMMQKKNNSSQKIIMIHIGKCSNAVAMLKTVQEKYGIHTHAFGLRTENEIADILAQSDLGISTYPKILFQKSGTIAAMLYNKLPVVLIRNSFVTDNRSIPFIKEIKEIEDIDTFAASRVTDWQEYGAEIAAKRYVDLIQKHL